MHPRPRIHLAAYLAFALTLCLFLGAAGLTGCGGLDVAGMRQGVAQAQEHVSETRRVLDEATKAKADIDAIVATLPEGEVRDAYLAKSAEAEKLRVKALELLDRMEPRLQAAQAALAKVADDDTLGGVEAIAVSVAPLFGPYGAAAGGIATALLALLRAANVRKAGRRIALSIEAVKKSFENGGFDKVEFGATGTKELLSAIQGPAGKRIVDEAQGKVWSLPF